MATVNLTISDALDAKIKDPTSPWGSAQAWKDWVKAQTKLTLLNATLRQIAADADAAEQTARAAVIAADAGM